MSEFLAALKADLLDRRLAPLVGLAAVVLIAAIAYVVLGGSSSTSAPSVASTPVTSPAAAPTGLAVTPSSPQQPVAETTEGAALQHHGASRDPFALLPGTKAAGASTSTGSSKTPAGGSGSAAPQAQPEAPKRTEVPTPPPTKSSSPAKPKTIYHVAVLFGLEPAPAAPQGQLTPFVNLKLMTPLPSAKQPLLVFRGVIPASRSAASAGASASFTLVGEAILHGAGTCLPSPTQCQSIDLHAGQAEQLEYLPPSGGPALDYELKLVSIVAASASAAAVKRVVATQSKAGHELLARAGLLMVPYLSSGSSPGALRLTPRRASSARAHVALQRPPAG